MVGIFDIKSAAIIATASLFAAILFTFEIPKPKPADGCQCDNEYIVNVALKEVGVREQGGNNRGERVEEYIAAGGGKPGEAWCAYFLVWTWLISDCGLHGNGWSPSWFKPSRQIQHEHIKGGDTGGVYNVKLKRVSHIFLVWKTKGDLIYTIEGNTSSGGGRDGDGVRSLVRHKKNVAVWSRNWCVN
jgi:hypothetical protein